MKKRIPKRIAALLLLAAAAWIIAGCGPESAPTAVFPPTAGAGSLALGVTAAEESAAKSAGGLDASVVELYLTFDSIVAYRAPADARCDSTGPNGASSNGPHGDGSAEPIDIGIDPVTVEIMELGSALTGLVADADLPEGRYPKLEIGLVAAWAVREGGDTVAVGVPPRGDSLLKVVVPFDIVAGETAAVVLEIDLARSLREYPPGSGELVLRPVLRAVRVPAADAAHWRHRNAESAGSASEDADDSRGADENGRSDENGMGGGGGSMGDGGVCDGSMSGAGAGASL